MPRAVDFAKAALRDLRGLDETVAERIVDAITRFAESGKGDVKRLVGGDDEYRLRVGDYRVIFTLPVGRVVVLRVQHRREVYRR